jgi:hypothetical protein
MLPTIVIGLTCLIGGALLGYKYGSRAVADAAKLKADAKNL